MSLPRKLLDLVVNGVLKLLAVFHLDSANRVVLALSPALVAAAGFVVTEIARLLPGVTFTTDQVSALFMVGATLATTKILLWLHGWQQYEKRLPNPAVAKLVSVAAPLAGPPKVEVHIHQDGTAAKNDLEGEDVPPPPTPGSAAPAHEVGQP